MLSPNIAFISGYLCTLMKYQSFFVETHDSHDSFSRFLKEVTLLVKTRQPNFTELRPFRKQSEMQ